MGYSVKEAHRATKIDPWFLVQVKELVDIENRLKEYSLPELSKEEMLFLKEKGFSDRRLAKLLKVKEDVYKRQPKVRMLCRRSASLIRMTRTSRDIASSILWTLSA